MELGEGKGGGKSLIGLHILHCRNPSISEKVINENGYRAKVHSGRIKRLLFQQIALAARSMLSTFGLGGSCHSS